MEYALKSLATIFVLLALLALCFFVMGLDKIKANKAANVLIFAIAANLIAIIWLFYA